ncbi:MAG: RNA-splicing factor [Watsoniomyces obsoletus]|nr:MAG: RNA-splicing factor [Watsoniomyces obsoletus]
MSSEEAITLEYEGHLAIITLANKTKLNALSREQYSHLGNLLRQVDQREEITVTLLIGQGPYFSAGADFAESSTPPEGIDERKHWLQFFVAKNLDVTRAFYTHSKILVTGLNGPVIGLSAALIAFSDFIYATPRAFLLTPFTSLGLVAEGGASQAFVQRMGIAKANEALIMSKRITAEEMLQTGFVNKIIETDDDHDDGMSFRTKVVGEIKERLGNHLNRDSLLAVKKLIRAPEREKLDRTNMAEVFDGLDRFVAGIPQEQFRKLATGAKKHKL